MRERLVYLLSRLIRVDSESIKDLSYKLKVTTRTIRNEVNELNDLLASNQLSQFSIKKGVIYNNLIKSQQEAVIKTFLLSDVDRRYLTPQQRILYLLLTFLSSNEPIFIIDIQNELEVSKSTMDSTMRSLRSLLKEYNLKLTTDPKSGAQIVGDECTIRMMFCDLIIQKVNVTAVLRNEFFDNSLLTEKLKRIFVHRNVTFINQNIKTLFSNSNLAMNDNYRHQAIVLTTIWIARVTAGYFIKDDIDSELPNLNTKQTRFVNELITYFDLKINNSAEVSYLSFIVSSFNKSENRSLDNWVKAQIISVSLIEWMEKALGFPFSQSENLFEEIYYHISSLLQRTAQQINIFNPLKNTIEQRYPKIYNAVSQFTEAFQDQYKLSLSDDEKGYLAIYFLAAQAEVKKNQIFKYRIAVVCNYGLATGKLLAAKLEQHFRVEVVAILSVSELDILKKLHVDLIFKTVDVEIPNMPSVKLNPIPTKSDLEIVKHFLEKHAEVSKYEEETVDPTKLFNNILTLLKASHLRIDKNLVASLQRVFHTNHLNINEREVQPMLKDLIRDDQIQLKRTAENWRDTIQISAKPLLEENYISQSYIQAMISSLEEYGPYIVIGPSVALAHARPEDGVNKLGISVTTLKNPVYFGNPENDPVRIIFCLAAIDNYSHLNVMKAIVQLINEPKRVKKLVAQNRIDNFKQILFTEDPIKNKEKI
uniref:Transcriptional antiterminator and PTS system component IIA n=1 Tax=Loigolactobacillus rennini TaxID=238013 RepID=A0A1K2I8W5_9LACO|nr:Transcriptional antiterminator and PTS system component IIA [Loigolactobacillus rennini]